MFKAVLVIALLISIIHICIFGFTLPSFIYKLGLSNKLQVKCVSLIKSVNLFGKPVAFSKKYYICRKGWFYTEYLRFFTMYEESRRCMWTPTLSESTAFVSEEDASNVIEEINEHPDKFIL